MENKKKHKVTLEEHIKIGHYALVNPLVNPVHSERFISMTNLIDMLEKLPDEAKSLKLRNIYGCLYRTDGKSVCGFQFHLTTEDGQDRYVLVPQDKGEYVYDSFGKRCVVEESGATVQSLEDYSSDELLAEVRRRMMDV